MQIESSKNEIGEGCNKDRGGEKLTQLIIKQDVWYSRY